MGKFYKRRKDATAGLLTRNAAKNIANKKLQTGLCFRVVKLHSNGQLFPASDNITMKDAAKLLLKTKAEMFAYNEKRQDYLSYNIVEAWVCRVGVCCHRNLLGGKTCLEALSPNETSRTLNCKRPQCNKQFKTNIKYKLYCNPRCSNLHHSELRRERDRNRQPFIPSKKQCGFCQKTFIQGKRNQTHCSKKCSMNAWNRRVRTSVAISVAKDIHSIMLSEYKETNKPVLSNDLLQKMITLRGLGSIRCHLFRYNNKLWKRLKPRVYIPLEKVDYATL